jgi:hypothetical protein
MIVELLTMWRGFPAGSRLESLSDGVALILIQRGVASAIETRSSDEANSRAGDAQRGQEATRNRKQRHKP